MKKVILLALTLATSALIFTSCSKDDDDKGAATITAASSYDIPTDLSQISIPVTVSSPSSDADLQQVTISVISTVNGSEVARTLKTVTSFSNKQAYGFVIVNTTSETGNSLIALNYTSDMTKIRIVAQIKDGDETTKYIELRNGGEEPGEIALSSPVNFEFVRVGGNTATGDLEELGLSWPSQTASNIRLTPTTGTKLVKFTASQWASITTKEGLAAAVDAASGITEFTDIATKDDTKTYDIVLATKKSDGVYSLIHITKRVTTSAATPVRTISGQYKR